MVQKEIQAVETDMFNQKRHQSNRQKRHQSNQHLRKSNCFIGFSLERLIKSMEVNMFNALQIELIGSNQYKIITPLIYENNQLTITIHSGFISDGASIPSVLHGLIGCPFGEPYTKAAFMHDLFYRSGVFTRKMSDYLFLEMMIKSGVERAKARAIYLGVRVGGESSYLGMGSPVKFREFIEIKIKE